MEDVMNKVIGLYQRRQELDDEIKPLQKTRATLQKQIKLHLADIASAMDVPYMDHRGYRFSAVNKHNTSYSKKNVSSFLSEEQHQQYCHQYSDRRIQPSIATITDA